MLPENGHASGPEAGAATVARAPACPDTDTAAGAGGNAGSGAMNPAQANFHNFHNCLTDFSGSTTRDRR